MTTIVDLGKLRFYWAGDYVITTEYELNDVVRYGGNVYVYTNVVRTIGNIPTNTAYWALMVEGINFVGNWSASTQYYVGDAVAYGSTIYVSLADNINKQPDLFPLIWSQFAVGIQFEGVYSPTTTYQANDVVTYGPSTYIAKQTTNNNPPTNATFWSSFVQGISPQSVYNNTTQYFPGNLVAYGANLYTCIATTTGNIPTNTAYWTLFVDTIRTRGAWTATTLYYINDIVVVGGNTYQCLVQNTSSAAFATDLAAGKWAIFNSGIRWRGPWATATSYLVNDSISNGGSNYICLVSNTSGASFAADLAAGKWQFFAGDAVVPIFSTADKGKSLTIDAAGTGTIWSNTTASTNTFYVSPNGSDSNPGTNLSLPFASIQAAVAAVPSGQSATIHVKPGTYAELLLPIIVPPSVAIVGDNQRTVIITPGAGLAADGVTPNNEATMFLMSNASTLHSMTFSGMTGWVPGSTASDIRTSTPKGIVVALNPASPVTTKSPYIVECSAIGTGCIGAYVNGAVQGSGYKSMLFHGYTVIANNGIGFWVAAGSRGEIVSCFTYYAYFGYASSGGGVIRALNGNNSYGTWGAASFGFLASETPLTGALYGKQLTVTIAPILNGFTAGRTVTGQSSGATGTITNLQASAGKVYYNQTSVANFTNGETINDGFGNTLVIDTGGVSNQKGFLLVANGFSAAPSPGASIQIAGDSASYVIQSVSGTYVNSSSVMSLALAQEKLTASAPGAVVTIRYGYSQIRLTGHDFLNIGTGGISTTNYPGIPTQPPAQGNEVNEDLPGRVYYVSTDQDGNFRVGEYFRVDQATGTATLNANAFNLAGLTSLRLGSIGAQLGETINEFSSDATLSGNSNEAVPTEYAVRGYVNNRVPQALPTSVGQTGKVLTSAGTTLSWSALDLNSIVGAASLYTAPGYGITSQYAVFSNVLIAPYTWSLTGTVPSGVSINSSTGLLALGSGTAAGSYSFNVVATGSAGSGTATKPITAAVNTAVPVFANTDTLPTTTLVVPSSSFSNNSTQATVGSGTPAYTISAGALPSWVTLGASTGLLTGTAPGSTAPSTAYTFTVTVTNGPYTASKSFTWTFQINYPVGQSLYYSPGTYTWVAPAGVTSVSAVAVGGGGSGPRSYNSSAGGGSGGGLGWKNNISVTPGNSYTVVVGQGATGTSYGSFGLLGGNSYFVNSSTVAGYGGGHWTYGGTGGPNQNAYGGGWTGDGGGAGGYGSSYASGSGAGGYVGNGGNPSAGTGSGGAGAAGYNYSSTYGYPSGGGVGLLGQGSNAVSGLLPWTPSGGGPGGAGGAGSYNGPGSGVWYWGYGGSAASGQGTGGMYGENPYSGTGSTSSNLQGGFFGAGGGGQGDSWPQAGGYGGTGGVRIIWGAGRAFPSTLTADQTPVP